MTDEKKGGLPPADVDGNAIPKEVIPTTAESPAQPAPPADSSSPVERPTKSRLGTRVSRRGGPGAKPMKAIGEQPLAPKKPGLVKKALVLSMPVIALVAIVGGFFVKVQDGSGDFLWKAWARKLGVIDAYVPPERPRVTTPDRTPAEIKYDEALTAKSRCEFYIKNQLRAIEENSEKQTLEAIDEAIKELEGYQIRLRGYMEHLGGLMKELNKPEGQSVAPHLDNLECNREFQAYQQYTKGLGAHIAKWKDLYRQKGGKIEEPAPAPVVFKPRMAHPWGRYPNGVWTRHRIIVRDGADDPAPFMEFKDTGLTAGGLIADKQGTIASERYVKGENKGVVDEEVIWEVEGLKVVGEEAVQVGSQPLKCTVVEVGGAKVWYAAEGRGAGRLVVKRAEGSKAVTVTAIAEEPIDVGGKIGRLNCLRYEAQEVDGESKATLVAWVNEDIPGGIVRLRRQIGDRVETQTLIERGADWSKRPPFPTDETVPKEEGTQPEPPKEEPPKGQPPQPEPPKEIPPEPAPPQEEPPKADTPPPTPELPKEEPKPPTAQEHLEKADALVTGVTADYKGVAEAMKTPPSDKSAVEELLKKARSCEERLYDAQMLYTLARNDAPDRERVQKRIAMIDKLLGHLKGYIEKLEAARK